MYTYIYIYTHTYIYEIPKATLKLVGVPRWRSLNMSANRILEKRTEYETDPDPPFSGHGPGTFHMQIHCPSCDFEIDVTCRPLYKNKTFCTLSCLSCKHHFCSRKWPCGCGLKWHHCDSHRNLGFECGRYCLPRTRSAKPMVCRKEKLIAPSDENFPSRHLCNSALRTLAAPTLGNSHGAKRTRLVEDLEA